jgi:hypothetical protein
MPRTSVGWARGIVAPVFQVDDERARQHAADRHKLEAGLTRAHVGKGGIRNEIGLGGPEIIAGLIEDLNVVEQLLNGYPIRLVAARLARYLLGEEATGPSWCEPSIRQGRCSRRRRIGTVPVS